MTDPSDPAPPAGATTAGDSHASLFFRRLLGAMPTPGPGLAPGKQVGDFRLVRLIGQGGMGQVWEASQGSLGERRVALKFVRPERVTEKQLDYFQREARAGGRLSHPGIVAVHGYGEDAGLAWIAMEYVDGGVTLRESIDELAREDEVPQGYDREAARLVAELADALQAAHDASVIHRDLKPQNILITPDNKAKVTDFGLARITDETALSHSGDIAGTYFYMSPEQVAAKRAGIDHRSDVFSLGVVLYELLTLRRPFQGDTTHQIAAQILAKDPPDPRTIRSRIPRELVVISGKALEKDRDRRFASMAELAADLRRYLANEPIRAQPPTRLDRLVKWTRRNPTKSVASTVAAIAFVAISLLLAENVRANRDLTRTVDERDEAFGSLEQANVGLAEQTRAAQQAAREAREAADAERAAKEDVLRLSRLQDLEDLIAEADDPERMWPPHPERIAAYESWIGRAQELVDELPVHRAKRDELRASALPRSEGQRRREREAHPRFLEFVKLEGRITAMRRALEQRRDGKATELPDVDEAGRGHDPTRVLSRAAAVLEPEGGDPARAPEALALSRRALELLGEEDPAERAEALSLLARAAFALGRDDEALNAAFEALELAEGEAKKRAGAALAALELAVTEATSAEGLALAEAELSRLESERALLDVLVDERRDWRFPDKEEEARWWHNQLTKLIAGLEALTDEESGLLAAEGASPEHGWSLPRRLVSARELATTFAPGGEHNVRWKEALSGIANAYPGLELSIQTGIVPIGADPSSGLWEFWVVLTGREPARGADGVIAIVEEMGIVLVLIPGGTFWMGAQRTDPHSHNHDLMAVEWEGPVHEVELSAYFLSKYEVTQAQWKRLTGRNPSGWSPDSKPGPIGWTNPVENVDWNESRRSLRRLGLELPSEAQWEHGGRAGASGSFSNAVEDLASHANLADQSHELAFAGGVAPESWNDGFGFHAAIGSLAPNAFGLHDVHGNVYEWCLDGYEEGFYKTAPRVDPINDPVGARFRVTRGGSFADTASNARLAFRYFWRPAGPVPSLGVRPARAITTD